MHVCPPWNVPAQIPLRYFFSWSTFDYYSSITKHNTLKHTHTEKFTWGKMTSHSFSYTFPLQSTAIFYLSQAFSKALGRQYIYKLMGSLITSLVKNIKSEVKNCLYTPHPFGLESQAIVIELPSWHCMLTNARWRWAQRSFIYISCGCSLWHQWRIVKVCLEPVYRLESISNWPWFYSL